MPLQVGDESLPAQQGSSASLVQVRIYFTNGFPRAGQSTAQMLEPHCSQASNMLSSPINNWKTGLL